LTLAPTEEEEEEEEEEKHVFCNTFKEIFETV
jgi:hypothetical protein